MQIQINRPKAMDRVEQLLIAAISKQMAGKPAKIPEHGRLLWDAFCRLSRSRQYNEIGPQPISYQEISAYCSAMQIPLSPHHISVITGIDQAWLRLVMEKRNQPVKAMGQVSSMPMTEGIFDAMFG